MAHGTKPAARREGASPGLVARLRSFNRDHSRLIGTLANGYLGTRFTLQEARVLYEIAQAPRCTQKDVREKTGMDQGFVSRILSRFERRGLLRKAASATDGRAQHLFLSPKGKAAFRQIDELASGQAAHLLGSLSPDEEDRLGAALATVQELLHGGARARPPDLTIREERVGDLGWTFHRQAVVYDEEFGYSPVFEKYVSQGLAPYLENRDPARDRLWMAEIADQKVGFIAVHHVPDRPGWAKLRWFLVEKEARGRGAGIALLNTALEFCRDAGYSGVFLGTVSDLDAARRLYERAGFRLAQEKKSCEWAPWAREQRWELRFDAHRGARRLAPRTTGALLTGAGPAKPRPR